MTPGRLDHVDMATRLSGPAVAIFSICCILGSINQLPTRDRHRGCKPPQPEPSGTMVRGLAVASSILRDVSDDRAAQAMIERISNLLHA